MAGFVILNIFLLSINTNISKTTKRWLADDDDDDGWLMMMMMMADATQDPFYDHIELPCLSKKGHRSLGFVFKVILQKWFDYKHSQKWRV